MRRVWPWLRPVLGVAVLVVPVSRLGVDAFLAGFRLVDARAVVAALGLGAVTTLLGAGRWCLVARRLGLSLPISAAFADYYRAGFLNAVLPVGVLGDADRAFRHGRRTGDLGRGVRAVLLERAGGQVVLLAAAAVAVVVAPSVVPGGPGGLVPGLAAGLAVALAAVLGAVVAARLAARWWPRARAALVAAVTDLRRGLARDTWPGVLLLSAAALAGHLTLFLVAARTAGASAPAVDLLPLLVLALLAMGLPMNVGGFGPREAFASVAFGAAGLGAALGLTVAVTYGVLALVASLPGAAVVIVGRRAPGRAAAVGGHAGGPATPATATGAPRSRRVPEG